MDQGREMAILRNLNAQKLGEVLLHKVSLISRETDKSEHSEYI